MRSPESQALCEALAEPFEPHVVRWKPQNVKNNRALAAAYIDSRIVQDRLDEVVGPENWTEQYHVLPDGSVTCRLSIRFGAEWVTKEDVGGMSEQPDQGDRLKAAFSDALKRAAVKFGIGRYLYRLPSSWVDYDPVKKQIVAPPRLPAFALPKAKRPAAVPGAKTADPESDKLWVDWRAKISAMDTVADANKLVKPFGALKASNTKTDIWNYFLDMCEERGWFWHQDKTAFVAEDESEGPY